MPKRLLIFLTTVMPLVLVAPPVTASAAQSRSVIQPVIHYRTVDVDGIKIFYRAAGNPRNPTILLLHGFPTSSQMYRNLIPLLADRYYVVAPDYPGFGQSAMPSRAAFNYTFENLSHVVERFTETLKLTQYTLYMMDYGAPIGFRMAVRHPERISALVVQNGNAYVEGLQDFWVPFRQYWSDNAAASREVLRGFLTLQGTIFQYTTGVRDVSLLSPDAWTTDQYQLDRAGNQEIQLDLFYDYRTNVELYPVWQEYLRTHQPRTLVVWGKNDPIFPAEGAEAFKRDLARLEFHLLDTGHFALETHATQIALLMRRFLNRRPGS